MNLLPIQFKQGSSCQMKRKGLRMRSCVKIVSHSCLVYLNYFLSAFTSFTVCLYILQDGFFDQLLNKHHSHFTRGASRPHEYERYSADRIPTVIAQRDVILEQANLRNLSLLQCVFTKTCFYEQFNLDQIVNIILISSSGIELETYENYEFENSNQGFY